MNEEEKKNFLERFKQLFRKKDTEIGVVDSIETKLTKKENLDPPVKPEDDTNKKEDSVE